MKFRTLLMVVVLSLFTFSLLVELGEACTSDSECQDKVYCMGTYVVEEWGYCDDSTNSCGWFGPYEFDCSALNGLVCSGGDLVFQYHTCGSTGGVVKCVVSGTSLVADCEYGCSNGACNPCTPITSCGSVECGTISDGCGGTLNCGGCPSGEVCSGGKCVCDPYTCSELGVECGTISDGCGGTINCGSCPSGEVCSGGQCVCDPYTCSELGVECGTISDGCGGTLNCGSCPSPSSTCSGDTVVTTSYTCEGGTCEPTTTTKYCSDVSRCDGNTYVYQDRWCSGGSCTGGTTYNYPCGSDGCSNGIYYDRGCDPDDGCFEHPKDGDGSETYCNCCSSCDWNIGGEVSATTCCGDDANEYVSGRVADNTLDPLSEYNPFPNDSDNDAKACCNPSTDCVYNNRCYTSNTQGPDVDDDGDYDWCGYPGTWRDCNTSAQCGGGTVFGDYEVCDTNSHDCKVDCYNKPCVAGQSYCDDEFLGERLYCMNSTSSATQSSYVENPAGENTNERYCHQDEYYDPYAGSCKPKYGEDICYNYLDEIECGTGNTASVVYCNLVGQYCSFDTGENKDIVKIESTDAPLQVVGTGPRSPTTTGSCIETDGGDKPKEWGCVYIMNAENNQNDNCQEISGEIGCDYVSGGNLIEFYCSGGEIFAKNYTCTIIGTKTPYCFENPSNPISITPPTEPLPINQC